ncbi:MAG: hypothetical protein JWO03_3482 [Bacteroidetes bacterium]|nr:hypothetical protein [Bacteroidota bacterium]
MITPEIVLKVRKHIPVIILLGVISSAIAYFIFSEKFVDFRSETSFYVNENIVLNMSLGHMETQEIAIMSTIAANKVMLLIGSDELKDSIIKDFDLYKHYGIDANGQFGHEMALLQLTDRMRLIRDPKDLGVLRLSVTDKDRFVAAGIANKVVMRINAMNQQILTSDLRKKADQFESVLPEVKDKALTSRADFIRFIDSTKPLTHQQVDENVGLQDKYRMVANDLVGKMNKNSSQYEEMFDQYHNIMGRIKTVGDDQWQGITVVKKAMPDIKSWRQTVLQYSVAAGFAVAFIYLVLLLYVYQNEEHARMLWHALLGRKVPQKPVAPQTPTEA